MTTENQAPEGADEGVAFKSWLADFKLRDGPYKDDPERNQRWGSAYDAYRWEGWKARAALAAQPQAHDPLCIGGEKGPCNCGAVAPAQAPAEGDRGEPQISTEHGPWLPSQHDEGETYCKRCLTRRVFADKRKCDPHIVYAPNVQPKGTHSPDECSADVFARGESVFMLDVPKEQAEAAVKIASALTGDKYDWHYFGGRVHVKRLAAPASSPDPAQVAPVSLLEAIDYALNQAPCECPHSMRFERGEHMSGCYLFDLNVEYAKTAPAISAPVDEVRELMSMTEAQIDDELRALGIDPATAAQKGGEAVAGALGRSGGYVCGMCGKASPHDHTPDEVVIFRNGIKRGASQAPAPEHGRWVNADDIDALTKRLDSVLNGPRGAESPKLCDIVAQLEDDRVEVIDRRDLFDLVRGAYFEAGNTDDADTAEVHAQAYRYAEKTLGKLYASQAPAVKAESDDASFEVWEGDELFAGTSGPRAQAWAELLRYAAQCEGVVRVFEVSRVERTLSYVPVQGSQP